MYGVYFLCFLCVFKNLLKFLFFRRVFSCVYIRFNEAVVRCFVMEFFVFIVLLRYCADVYIKDFSVCVKVLVC